MVRMGLEKVRVGDLMTRSPLTVGPETSLAEAAGTMLETGVRHLPVVDEDLALVGIVSERDIRQRLGTELGQFHHAAGGRSVELVQGVMTPDPMTLAPDLPAARAVEILVDDRVGALPVVDDGDRVIGILSYVDVLGWLVGRPSGRDLQEGAPA